MKGIYRFYSNPNSEVRVAIVGKVVGTKLQVAVSRCSAKDQFIRRKGRHIAEGRLSKGKLHSEIELNTEELTNETFVALATNISNEVINTKNLVHIKEDLKVENSKGSYFL